MKQIQKPGKWQQDFHIYIYIYMYIYIYFFHIYIYIYGFPGGSEGKASACNAGDLGVIPGSGRSPGEGNGNPLQYSCLENPMDGGAWWAIYVCVCIYIYHIYIYHNTKWTSLLANSLCINLYFDGNKTAFQGSEVFEVFLEVLHSMVLSMMFLCDLYVAGIYKTSTEIGRMYIQNV